MPYEQGEMGYLQLLRDVCDRGERRIDRTGTGTLSVFAPDPLRFDLSKSMPVYTTKRVAWKTVIKELLWFVKGHTDARLLQEQNVHIWDGHTSNAFLRARSLPYREGVLGPGYGWQWRRFGAPYDDKLAAANVPHSGVTAGFDQLRYVERLLREDRFSRRIFLSSWNANDLDQMALAPCHVSCQFYVTKADELSCHVYMRSNDLFLGNPFNVLSYATLTSLLAKRCLLKPKELIMSFGDAHVYVDHLTSVSTQLSRKPFPFPTMTVDDRVQHIEYQDLVPDDFCIKDYRHHPSLSGKMSV